MIRILLVDDHAAFRGPLAFMLEREPDITVVGQAGTLAEARGQLTGVDIALIDLALPDGHGVDLIRDLRRANRHASALVLTASLDRRDAARVVEAGAAGILHKSVEIEEIIGAIRRLHAGEILLSRQEVAELLQLAGQAREQEQEAHLLRSRLTAREREVLRALADGLSDREIAVQLHVSDATACNHVARILDKLEASSRLQAVMRALRHGIITLD